LCDTETRQLEGVYLILAAERQDKQTILFTFETSIFHFTT